MEGSGLHGTVDGISTSLAHVGLLAGVDGPECLHTALGRWTVVSRCEHFCYDHGDETLQVHSAHLVTGEVWKQEGIAWFSVLSILPADVWSERGLLFSCVFASDCYADSN
jgi:hypothetical protein